jgi:iron complex outermembrane receptor protein
VEMKRPSPVRSGLHKSKLAIPTYASALAMCVMGVVNPALAQGGDEVEEEELYVTGIRSSIKTAQQIKRDAASIVDSVVAEDIGKLPDRSVTEALQRVPGVTVSRFDNPTDPEHFAGEGAGVTIRGLPQVRGELNGRDIFSAGGGRGLSFDDVPAELMAGVDVYKSPTADRVEGGLGGIVNLRTRMPFDQDGQLISGTAKANYGDIIEETNFEFSGLYSNRWDVGGDAEFGFLIDLSTSELSSRADNIYTRAYHPRNPGGEGDLAEIEPDRTVWVPRGADWRRNDYERKRDGQYLALQYSPNSEAEIYFTAFRSEAERTWLENGFFLDAGGGFDSFLPVPAEDNWVYDENNALVSGSITTAQGNGVPFGTSTRLSENKSETSDFSLGFKWQVTDALHLSGDIQRVESSSEGEDYTLGLVAYPQVVTVGNLDTMSGTPSIEVADGFLEDYSNYSYGQMMAIVSKNEAESTAARLDLEYEFEDSIVKSIKAGVRFSEKSADNRGGNNWSARYQPWQVGTSWQPFASTDDLPRIENTDYIREFSFDNFQRGDAQVPTSAWLYDASLLRDFEGLTSAIVEATPGGCCGPDQNAYDLDNPNNINTQDEETQAAYIRLDFGAGPVSGNLGVRYVSTENVAHGQLSFPTFEVPTGETDGDGNAITVQPFFAEDTALDAENSYNHVLPSLNLRYNATDELIFRFAASKAIWRPEFDDLQALLALSASFREDVTQPDSIDGFSPDMVQFTLSSGGTNPYLEPMEAKQFDLTAEYYFNDDGGMVYAAIFKKEVEDFFRTETFVFDELEGFPDVVSELTVNTGEADISGFEIGATYFFENLPAPFDGLGIQANYTNIDSSTEVPLESSPVDTDGSEYGNLPLEGLSENTYNIVLMYEKDKFYSRLAYNYRSDQLQSVGPNGWNGSNAGVNWRLPVYADDYGQLDFSMGYNFTDNLSLNFDAYNIGQSDTRGFIQQNGAGEHTAFVYSQDTRYSLSIRASF